MTREAIITVRRDGVVLSSNRAGERLFGFAPGELDGSLIEGLSPPGGELAGLLEQLRGGGIEDVATALSTRNGDRLDVLISLTPIRSPDGNVTAAVLAVHDANPDELTTTALRQSEGRWRAVVESAVDGMIVTDAKGAIETFNPAAERLFGYPAAEVIGCNVAMLMPAPDCDQHDAYLEHYLRTGHHKIIGTGREVVGRRRDGSTFPLHLAVGELTLGGEQHFTGILHDLSARVELERRVGEQNALAHLGEMAAVLAHGVRNPLAAVRGAVQVIGGRLPVGSRDALVVAEIIARIDSLSGLMKEMLLFAHTPTPRFTRVDLDALLRTVAASFLSEPGLSGHRFVIEGTAEPIVGDPDLLTIAVENIFRNAAQANEGRGATTVLLAAGEDARKVIVTDTGPGLSADANANLFRPFFTTKSRGTGLGLATAKRLIELHGGVISVHSEPAGGTTVVLTLPQGGPARSADERS